MADLIGIDIGVRFVRGVVLSQRPKQSISDIFFFPTPFSNVSSAREIDAKQFFDKITSYVPLEFLKKAQIGVNILSSLVTVSVVYLPKMSKKELDIAVIAEARRKMIPPPGPNSVFEYSILSEVAIDNVVRYEILVIKTERHFIEEVLRIFKPFADISPFFIGPTCYAIINSLAYDPQAQQKDTAIIDLGYDSIDIAIAKKGKLYFYRNINFGLKNIISNIAGSLAIDFQEAEKVINDIGVPKVDIDLSDKVRVAEEIMRQKYELPQYEAGHKDVNVLELRVFWNTQIERAIHEIRRTLHYYSEQTGKRRVEDVLFLGEGSLIQGYVPSIIKEIGGNSRLYNPFEAVNVTLEGQKSKILQDSISVFAPAFSIAKSMTTGKKMQGEINFLPSGLKKRNQRIQNQILLTGFGIFMVCFIFLAWFKVFVNNYALKASLEGKRAEIEKAKGIISTLDGLKSEREKIDIRTSKVGEIVKQRVNISQALNQVASLMPGDVFLETLTISKGASSTVLSGNTAQVSRGDISTGKSYAISLTARCFSDYETAVRLADEFRKRLEDDNNFVNVNLLYPDIEKISPVIENQKEISLTQPKLREFNLSAELVIRD
ncbi:MAG: pilus assembly protein PilM [Candidatus Omnitrophota bacterium]